jgi:hypothetical protein
MNTPLLNISIALLIRTPGAVQDAHDAHAKSASSCATMTAGASWLEAVAAAAAADGGCRAVQRALVVDVFHRSPEVLGMLCE